MRNIKLKLNGKGITHMFIFQHDFVITYLYIIILNYFYYYYIILLLFSHIKI